MPITVFAQAGSAGGNPSTAGSAGGNPSSAGSAGGNPPATPGFAGLENPLNSPTLMGLLTSILDVIMVFAVPLIVFFIIYAGFLYVTAQGNEETVKKAHRALLYAVVGGVIILGAWIILDVISGTIASF